MGRENENLEHTQKHVNVLSATTISKINSCLKVNPIDLYRKSTVKICLKVNKIDLHKKSTVKSKFASRSTKSTFIRRALQKLNLPQGHENRPLHEEHPQRGRNKIERRA